MKKSAALMLCLLTLPLSAASIQFDNLSKNDVEGVSKEFGVNTSHTAVAAPETEDLWGIEVGLVAGSTKTKALEQVIKKSGGDNDDFKRIHHGGLMARGHFMFDLFAELNYLPEISISGVTASSHSFAAGWNPGGFYGLPLDLAVGVNYAVGDVSFTQSTPVESKIDLETKTSVFWVGASKRFAFITPYVKLGMAKVEGDMEATGSILNFTSSQSESVSLSGRYFAAGANVQFLFIRLGLEGSQTLGVGRFSGKLSVDF